MGTPGRDAMPTRPPALLSEEHDDRLSDEESDRPVSAKELAAVAARTSPKMMREKAQAPLEGGGAAAGAPEGAQYLADARARFAQLDIDGVMGAPPGRHRRLARC